ncbi:MAG: BrnT family toxin [Candidatus Beckwithbacteria bacterium]
MRLKEFDWNKGNINKNLVKHKVDFREAEEIFFNKPVKFYLDKLHSQSEVRYTALGTTNKKRKLIISYTVRKNKIRIISARDQSKKERKLYGQS